MSIVQKAAGAAAILLCLSAPALAADNRLILLLGGEAYDGPPRFEVSFDGQVIGEGAVDTAIDTDNDGRFADARDKAAHVQSFDFKIPDDVFTPSGEVRVRLTNEAYGGDGSNRDRNLFLAAVTVNGRAVTLSGLSTSDANGIAPNETLGEFLVLLDGNQQGVSKPPRGGWPKAGPGIAPAKMVAERLPVSGLQPLKVPAEVASRPQAAPEAAEPLEVALLDEEPEAGTCQIDDLYNVVGFNENSNDLTPRLMQRLDQIVEAIGPQRCTAMITGYSSTQGDYATNALFSVERAQNVLRYLREQGVQFAEATATGVGETEQFGPELNANRRVVISVRP
jgi:outer membrane protein OmpA-like peptidoglycan-associated protein